MMNESLAGLVYRGAALLRGEATFRYLYDYKVSQWWSQEQLSEYHERTLGSLFSYLRSNIPFYHELGIVDLEDLPIVSKVDIKQGADKFTNHSFAARAYRKTTGGSTGQPITIVKDQEALAREQAGTLRCYGWAGVAPGARQARFWGVALSRRNRFISDVRDYFLNRRRYSAFNFTEDTLSRFCDDLERFRPTYLYGYVSIIDGLAQYLRESGRQLELPDLQAVITTSEILTDGARNNIEQVFDVKVFNEYGCGEVGSIAHQCEKGSMHINCENLFLETLDEDDNSVVGQPGRIVVTELHNRAQPLVRYDLGDFGTLAENSCECGRGLYLLSDIHGRAYDIVFGPDGRKYHPEFFIYIFEALTETHGDVVRQFQLVQKEQDLTISLIRGRQFDPEVEQVVRSRLEAEFGSYFTYHFRYPEQIAREASGKMRVVKRIEG